MPLQQAWVLLDLQPTLHLGCHPADLLEGTRAAREDHVQIQRRLAQRLYFAHKRHPSWPCERRRRGLLVLSPTSHSNSQALPASSAAPDSDRKVKGIILRSAISNLY